MGTYRRPHHRKPRTDPPGGDPVHAHPDPTQTQNNRRGGSRRGGLTGGGGPNPADRPPRHCDPGTGVSAPAMRGGGTVRVEVMEEVDKDTGVRHVTGGVFYRYTDIVYEWHPLLNPWQCNALKSLMPSEALVNPEHPLYTVAEAEVKIASTAMDPKDQLAGSGAVKALEGDGGSTAVATPQDDTVARSEPKAEPEDTLPGLYLHLAMFPSKKVRLLFTLEQIDYLRYYIDALDLVKCTKEDVRRWKGIVREEKAKAKILEEEERRKREEANKAGRIGESVVLDAGTAGAETARSESKGDKLLWDIPESSVVMVPGEVIKAEVEPKDIVPALNLEEEDEEEDEDVDPRYIPLPSSKSLVFPSEVEDLVVVRFTTVEQLKLAYRSPLKLYKMVKAGTFHEDLPAGSEQSKESLAKHDEGDILSENAAEEDTTRRTAIVDETGKVQKVIEEKLKGKGYEGIELGPSSKRPFGPSTTYHHAEQAFIVALQGGLPPAYVPGHEPSLSPYPIAGRGVFLTIDFEPWTMELGVILEVGWAACWFEDGIDGDFGNWREVRDQGHWIVKDHIRYRDSDLLAAPKPDYLYGESEILTLDYLRARVATLIDSMRAKCSGGPVYLVTHSAHKSLLSYGLIDIPTEAFHEELHPDGFVAPAYQTANGNGGVFVIDTSQMIAALTNGINDNPTVAHHDMTLEDMAKTICRGAPEPIEGFGHCGNDAWIHLECFLAMVQWNFDIMFSYFNRMTPEEPLTAAAAQEVADRELAEAKMWQEALEEEEEQNGIPDFDAKVRALEVDIGPNGPEGDDAWEEGEQAYKVWGPRA